MEEEKELDPEAQKPEEEEEQERVSRLSDGGSFLLPRLSNPLCAVSIGTNHCSTLTE